MKDSNITPFPKENQATDTVHIVSLRLRRRVEAHIDDILDCSILTFNRTPMHKETGTLDWTGKQR